MRKTLIIAALSIGFAAPAYAFHCPKDMAAIDKALPSTQVSAADKATVMALRKTGEAQHKAGDHAASVETLGKAKKILGIQ